jgi:hypothetical protein
MGKLTNLNPPAPIADTDLPPSVARDSELEALMAAHLNATDPHLQYPTQQRGDARYFRGRTETYTLDPPAVPPGETYRIFLPFAGAKFGDFASVAPIMINLITSNLWAFSWVAVVISENNIGIYLRNTHSVSIDPGSFQVKVLVINA